jgi:hypothetical protein
MKLLFTTLASFLFYTLCFSQTLSNDTLHWSENKKLAWADFKGKEIKGAEKAQQSLMAMVANYTKGNPLKPTSTTVVTVFDRKKSWTSSAAQTSQELKYYQVMFDIYELHSRMLRKEFKGAKLGLDPNKAFQEKYSLAIAALDEQVRDYNEETDSGANSAELNKWEEQIKKDLKALDGFKGL